MNEETDTKQDEQPKCSKCKINPAQAPHTCPYAEDIHDDTTTTCDCCPSCVQECVWDI